jgi:Bacterial protein of unknown function (DUF937)
MSRNSLNLVDLVKGYLSGDFTNKMSSLLGESTDKTRSGINAAIPGLLSVFDNAASTPEGARRLSSAVDDADDSMLGTIGTMLGPGSSSWIERGSGVLGSLLGSSALSALSGDVGSSTALSGKAVTMLLGFLGPLILGVLKREKQTRGLDSTGLSNLLASQRSVISAATPEGMFKTAGKRTEPVYGRAPLREVTEETYRPRTRPEPVKRNRPGWILPLALLLVGLGLIWHYASRATYTPSTVHAGREETGVPDPAANVKDEINSAQASAYRILRSITDPVSADVAAPRIRALNTRLDQTYSTFDSLPAGSKRAVSSFMPSVEERIRAEIGRVMKIPGVSDRIGSLLSEMLSKFQRFS